MYPPRPQRHGRQTIIPLDTINTFMTLAICLSILFFKKYHRNRTGRPVCQNQYIYQLLPLIAPSIRQETHIKLVDKLIDGRLVASEVLWQRVSSHNLKNDRQRSEPC